MGVPVMLPVRLSEILFGLPPVETDMSHSVIDWKGRSQCDRSFLKNRNGFAPLESSLVL